MSVTLDTKPARDLSVGKVGFVLLICLGKCISPLTFA